MRDCYGMVQQQKQLTISMLMDLTGAIVAKMVCLINTIVLLDFYAALTLFKGCSASYQLCCWRETSGSTLCILSLIVAP
jgi:hypothetical protein